MQRNVPWITQENWFSIGSSTLLRHHFYYVFFPCRIGYFFESRGTVLVLQRTLKIQSEWVIANLTCSSGFFVIWRACVCASFRVSSHPALFLLDSRRIRNNPPNFFQNTNAEFVWIILITFKERFLNDVKEIEALRNFGLCNNWIYGIKKKLLNAYMLE